MQTNIKTKDRKKLQLQILVDSECIHTRIDKQLVKKKKIKTEPMDRLFEFLIQIEPRMEKLHDMHY